MSMAGFDHVFGDSVTVLLEGGLEYKAVPPPVLVLLKMAAYLDDPYGRAKDLLDFRRLLRNYERDSERIFSGEVFQAALSDIEFAGAFLLGRDAGRIMTADDHEFVARFISLVESRTEEAPALDFDGRDTARFQQQMAAFRQGLSSAGAGC
jgi:predicted nucleotidyltransferase